MITAGNCAFPKASRLLNKADYSYVFNDAKRVGTRFFTLLYRSSQDNGPKIGLIVAKKYVKKAHDRNLIKRKLRESFRLGQHKTPAIDMVVLVKKGVGELDRGSLSQELDYLWSKLHKQLQK